MAKKKDRELLVKNNYVSTFQLTGRAVIIQNGFNIDARSEKSDWIYSRANIGVDCGDDNGTVFANLMGGYGANRENVIYVHGKTSEGRDDWKNQFQVAWEDRNDPNVLKEVGSSCFITVGLEKDSKGKTFYKNFLSAYDAISYVEEHLESGMVINVRGNLEYQLYNGNVNVQRNITNIALSAAEPDAFHARFTQTVLLDEDCRGEIDKEKGELDITGYVLEYMKDYNGHSLAVGERKGENVPLPFNFKYKINTEKPELAKKAIEKLFKIKKGSVNQITFEGMFLSSGATVMPTVDELTDDLRELIELGIYTEEEAIAACATNGNRERKMIITRPRVRNVQGDDGVSHPEVQIFEDVYTSADLDYFREMVAHKPENIDDAMNPPEDPEEVEFDTVDSDTSWLDEL